MIDRRLAATVVAAALLAPLGAVAAPDPHALFARERAASGGDAWNRVVAVRTAGVVVQGGAPGTFAQLLDHVNGFTKTISHVGPVTDVSGYDGVAWDFEGSTVAEQTLPGLQADNLTQAYVARDGWWHRDDPATMTSLGARDGDDGVRVVPRGGSAIDVWFDRRTGLIDRLVAHTDTGDVVTRQDDYRTVDDLVTSFHALTRDAAGAVTDTAVRSFTPLAALSPGALARPTPRYLGRVTTGDAATVPFRFDPRVGWAVADLRVGAQRAQVIFDSGASNYLTPDAARDLGLRGSGGIPLEGVGNGSVNGTLANLGTIAFGAAQLLDQHGVVAPLPFGIVHFSGRESYAGLVGSEFLRNLQTTFDFGARTMTFRPYPATVPAGAVVLPLLSDGAHAYVTATVNGVAGIYLLDTGDSGAITVFRQFASAHGLFRGPGIAYVSPGGVGGTLAYRVYRASSFTLGGKTFASPPVDVSEASAGAFASKSVAGNIGVRVLAHYRLTFDFTRSVVAFVPLPAVTTPLPTDRVGWSLTRTDPTAFIVTAVVPGAPAAQAGVAAGDRIVAIQGRNLARERIGSLEAYPLIHGRSSFTVTIERAKAAPRTVTIRPRDLLPAR